MHEGYDRAIGGGFDPTLGIVARALAAAHIVVVASPAYLRYSAPPAHPDDLRNLRGVVMCGTATGRIRKWTMQRPNGDEATAAVNEDIVKNDPASMRDAARPGLGVAMLALPDVLPDLADAKFVRLLAEWHADAGMISLYYASRRLLPGKTRVFIDFVMENFRQLGYAQRFDAMKEKGR